MTALESLAQFVHDFDLDALTPAALERLKLHLLDSKAPSSAVQKLFK